MEYRNRSWASAVMILLVLALTACSYGRSMPEELDMGHHHGGAHTGEAMQTVSCADLTEQPSNAPVREFHLTAEETSVKLDNGRTSEAWTYNGTAPGPELRVSEGDRIVVHLKNKDIGKGVSIHWHGVVLPCSQDGVPGVTQDAVWPGETFTYTFIARHPGTYWYHSHQMSSQQAKKGLIGRLIVEPKTPAVHYDRDYAVTMHMLNEKHVLTNGGSGGLELEAKPGETVRLRLINAFNTVQWMGVAGAPFKVVAMDGQDLNGPGELQGQWVPIGGGQRYDLSFTVPDSGRVDVYSRDTKGWSIALGKGASPGSLDKKGPLFDITSYGTPKEDGITADMPFDRVYDLKLGPLDINNKRFHEIPPITVKEGEWIKLRFEHRLGAEHPMHLHGHLFKVLTKNGKPLTGSPVYADSILLFQGDVVEVAFKADNPGLWMEHCHNLEHAAFGMTMMVNYEGVSTPYRVGTKSGNLPDL